MRKLKTPEEIIKQHGVLFSQMRANDIEQMIIATQRDTLETVLKNLRLKSKKVKLAFDMGYRREYYIDKARIENLMPKEI